MEKSGVQASRFNITFLPDENGQLNYDVSLDVQVSGYVWADITLYVYGFAAINKRVDPCSSQQLKSLCPLTNGEIDIISKSNIDDDTLKDIPGVAYTVPDIDAFAIVKVYGRYQEDNWDVNTKDLLACIRTEVTNTKTVEQTSVKWVTAVLSGVGLAVSAFLTYFGSSWTSQKIAATTSLMFSYFVSMSIIDMQAVDRVPPIVNAWTENVVWSVGLIRVNFMQKVFRWFVQATGGDPSTHLLYNTISVLVQRVKRSVSPITPPRVAEYMDFHEQSMLNGGSQHLLKRANKLAKETYVKNNHYLDVMRGIKRVGYAMKIEDTSIVLTSYTIFVFFCVCVSIIFMGVFFVFFAMKRSKKQESYRRAQMYRPMLPSVLKGTILTMVHIAFPSLMVFSMWEWIKQDSAAVIVIASFIFVLALAIMVSNTTRMMLIARRSVKQAGTPAALLYSHAPTMHRYGFLYQQFQARYYYFSVIYLVYNFVVAAFIGLSQDSGKVQGIAIFLIELALFIVVCVFRPWMDKGLNIINIFMQVIKTLNAVMFLFFSNLLTQPLSANAVMGVVYFVMNAAFSCFLLIYIIVTCILAVVRPSRDSDRAALARDDRMSFITDNPVHQDAAGELSALGAAAQADHEGAPSPKWMDGSDNPFESGAPDSHRTSHYMSDRTNTMTSVPTLEDVQTGIGAHHRIGSDTSFGLKDYSDEEKPHGSKKKWWVF